MADKTVKFGDDTTSVDIEISTGGIKDKDSSLGTDGQVLKSNGSKVYWDAAGGLTASIDGSTLKLINS